MAVSVSSAAAKGIGRSPSFPIESTSPRREKPSSLSSRCRYIKRRLELVYPYGSRWWLARVLVDHPDCFPLCVLRSTHGHSLQFASQCLRSLCLSAILSALLARPLLLNYPTLDTRMPFPTIHPLFTRFSPVRALPLQVF